MLECAMRLILVFGSRAIILFPSVPMSTWTFLLYINLAVDVNLLILYSGDVVSMIQLHSTRRKDQLTSRS